MSSNHLFYDKQIVRDAEQERINKILSKYDAEPVTDELKQKIHADLMRERLLGHLSIPFKLVTKRDPTGLYPEYIEVILDTRV